MDWTQLHVKEPLVALFGYPSGSPFDVADGQEDPVQHLGIWPCKSWLWNLYPWGLAWTCSSCASWILRVQWKVGCPSGHTDRGGNMLGTWRRLKCYGFSWCFFHDFSGSSFGTLLRFAILLSMTFWKNASQCLLSNYRFIYIDSANGTFSKSQTEITFIYINEFWMISSMAVGSAWSLEVQRSKEFVKRPLEKLINPKILPKVAYEKPWLSWDTSGFSIFGEANVRLV